MRQGYRYVSPTLVDLYSEAKPGCCAICDKPMAPSVRKPKRICGHPECVRTWHQLYGADRRARRAEAGLTRGGQEPKRGVRQHLEAARDAVGRALR